MNRRHALLAAAALFLASSTLARADEVGDIGGWLRRLGFDDIATTRSLLGRVQIRATGAIGTRELVVNPRTGEILRDVWVDAEGKVIRGKPYRRTADDGDHHGSSSDGGGDGGGDDNGNEGEGGGGDDGEDDGGSDDSDSSDGGSDDGESSGDD